LQSLAGPGFILCFAEHPAGPARKLGISKWNGYSAGYKPALATWSSKRADFNASVPGFMKNLYLYLHTTNKPNSHATSGLQRFCIKHVPSMAGGFDRFLLSSLS
jgi:hypothetical protein